jgi:hypothetical protein
MPAGQQFGNMKCERQTGQISVLAEPFSRGDHRKRRKSMKFVAFNGSPKKEGNTYHSMRIVMDELEKQGIETEVIQVGSSWSEDAWPAASAARKRMKSVSKPVMMSMNGSKN